jgi:hypothetical protein
MSTEGVRDGSSTRSGARRRSIDHELNWRRHPRRQRAALSAMLREIGYANALIARRQEDRSYLSTDTFAESRS